MTRMSTDMPWPRQWQAPNSALGVGLATVFLAFVALFVALAASGDPVGIGLVTGVPLFLGVALSSATTMVGVRARSARSVRIRSQPGGDAALAFPYSAPLTAAA
ncbi:MAG TPA: hypothetical protein VHV49_15645, partial [Pseudonocardiaceae bacterium]|nr:hypothetical protein [Pseudonocardiaceae bacterium]